ncbi:MAG: TlpA disulfide reductase family protein [Bacteroidota bacterium]
MANNSLILLSGFLLFLQGSTFFPDLGQKLDLTTKDHHAAITDTSQYFMEGYSFLKPDSTTFTFAEMKGKVLLLDFWATWCGPCRKKYPAVEELVQEINDPNLELVTISIDRDLVAWQSFFQTHDWAGTNLHLGWNMEHPLFQMVLEPINSLEGGATYKVAIPQYFLVDHALEVHKVVDITSPEARQEIERLLLELK